MLIEYSVNNLVFRDRWYGLGSHLYQFQVKFHWASYLTFLILNFLIVNKQNISIFFLASMQILNKKIVKVFNILLFYWYERHNKDDLKCYRKRTTIIIKWEIQETAIELGHRIFHFWQVLIVILGSQGLEGRRAGSQDCIY